MKITADDIANTVRMTRSVHKHKTVVVVEGLKDVRFYRLLTDPNVCFVTPADGKLTALKILELLRRTGYSGVLVIVDADLSIIKGQHVTDPDVVVTDHHDLEALLLKDHAFEKILSECDLGANVFGQDLRNRLATASIGLGYLRWINEDQRYCLRFKDLDYCSFVDKALTVNEVRMIRAVLANSDNPQVDFEQLQRDVVSLRDPAHDLWAICCGHDVSGILAAAITQLTGRTVGGSMIERNLRLAYNPTWFCDTRMYVQIKLWEQRNAPFAVLRVICQ